MKYEEFKKQFVEIRDNLSRVHLLNNYISNKEENYEQLKKKLLRDSRNKDSNYLFLLKTIAYSKRFNSIRDKIRLSQIIN